MRYAIISLNALTLLTLIHVQFQKQIIVCVPAKHVNYFKYEALITSIEHVKSFFVFFITVTTFINYHYIYNKMNYVQYKSLIHSI